MNILYERGDYYIVIGNPGRKKAYEICKNQGVAGVVVCSFRDPDGFKQAKAEMDRLV